MPRFRKTDVVQLKEGSAAAGANPGAVGKKLIIEEFGGRVGARWVKAGGSGLDVKDLRRACRVREDGSKEVFTVLEDDLDYYGILNV